MKRLFTNQTSSARLGSHTHSNRAISLLLSFALLLSMMPQTLLLPVRSVENEEQGSGVTETTAEETTRFDHMIGRVATFSSDYVDFTFAADPAAVTDYDQAPWTNAEAYSVYDYPNDDGTMTDEEYWALFDEFYTLEMVITDCFVSEETHGALWFKVEAAEGVTLPEIMVNNPWIFAFYSGIEGEEQNIFLNVGNTHLETGIAVDGDLPEGAEISVEIPTVDGETLPNVYDIKVLVPDENGELVEWQPIDEGKTVTVSIPVEGDIATVTHFVDYAKAIHEGLTFESVEGASTEELELLKPAIDAYEEKFGTRDHIALEIFEEIPIVDGVATFEASSFSAYFADGEDTQHKAIWVNNNYTETETIKLGEGNPFTDQSDTLECIYAGVVYVDQAGSGIDDQLVRIQTLWEDAAEGTVISNWLLGGKCHVDMHYSIDGGDTWEEMDAEAVVGNPDGTKKPVAKGDIPSNAFNAFDIGQEIWVVLTDNSDSTTIKYILLKMTKVATPDAGTVTFLDDNGEKWYEVKDEEKTFDNTPYLATNPIPNGTAGGDLPNPTIPDDPDTTDSIVPEAFSKAGYEYAGWKVVAISDNVPGRGWVLGNSYLVYPALRHGSVTLEAQWTPQNYTITYAPNGGTMPDGYLNSEGEYQEGYTVESIVTLPTPTRKGYTFTGWLPNNVGNWGETLIPRGSSVTGKYGTVEGDTVTLTAQWVENGDTEYTVIHIFEGLDGQNEEVVEILTGTTNHPTAAVPQQKVGFTTTFDVVNGQKNIEGDGSTIITITYTRDSYKVTWDTNGGIPATIGPVTYKYGATITAPTITIEKTGYDFVGWNGFTEGITMPASDLTFAALWAIDVYTITLDLDGGTGTNSVKFAYNATVDVTSLPFPTKAGFTFMEWTSSDVTFLDGKFNMPARDITLSAVWGARVSVNAPNCTIKIDGEVEANPYTHDYVLDAWPNGQIVITPTSGYKIVSVSVNGATAELGDNGAFSYTIPAEGLQGNVTIEVVTEEILVKVSIVISEGADAQIIEVLNESDIIIAITPHEGELISITKTIGTVTYPTIGEGIEKGYIFTAHEIKDNVTLVVTATSADVHYAVGSIENGIVTLSYTKEDGNSVSLRSDNGNADHTGIPHFENYSFTLDVATGNTIHNVIYADGSNETFNAVTKQKNYDGAMTGDAVVIAETKPTYTITWRDGDGNELKTDEVPDGVIPVYSGLTPTKTATAQHSYTFNGKWDPEIVVVSADATYTAQFDKTINQYTLWGSIDHGTVKDVNGNVVDHVTVDYGESATLIFYVDAGYEMISHTANGNLNDFDVDKRPTTSWTRTFSQMMANQTVYVTTAAIQYTITFDANDGEALDPMTYTIDEPIELPTPTRKGYKFLGWKVTTAGSNTWTVGDVLSGTVSSGRYGDVVLTAQWELAVADLTISVTGDADATFIFRVKDENGFELLVAVKGDSSVVIKDLAIGTEYTITELTGWSWEYAAVAAQSVTLVADGNTVQFNFTATDSPWLDGEASGEITIP